MGNNKSSWTTPQLIQLADDTNHKIEFDKRFDAFVWKVFLDGVWITQYENDFDTFAKPYEHMKFHLHRYKQELKERQEPLLKKLYKTQDTPKRISIARELKPFFSQQEIAQYLKLSIRTIKRHWSS